MTSNTAVRACVLTIGIMLCAGFGEAFAGAIFITGHDSDFHAAVPPEYDGVQDDGGHNNAPGAQRINQAALAFVLDPRFNSFFASGIEKFLFVEANEADANLEYSPLLGLQGLIASGFVEGTDFHQHGAGTLADELGLLGTSYSALVVASDCGGSLRQAELDILNSHSAAIMGFINAGGGLFAMAESNLCGPPDDPTSGITPDGGHFGFLPFVTSSTFNADESDPAFKLRLTSYGRGLGLTPGDVQGNFAHNVFGGTWGMRVVDSFLVNGTRVPLSLASRGRVSDGGVVPEPAAMPLVMVGLAAWALGRGIRARVRRSGPRHD